MTSQLRRLSKQAFRCTASSWFSGFAAACYSHPRIRVGSSMARRPVDASFAPDFFSWRMGELSPVVQAQALQRKLLEFNIEGINVRPRLGEHAASMCKQRLQAADLFAALGTSNWGEDKKPRLHRRRAYKMWEKAPQAHQHAPQRGSLRAPCGKEALRQPAKGPVYVNWPLDTAASEPEPQGGDPRRSRRDNPFGPQNRLRSSPDPQEKWPASACTRQTPPVHLISQQLEDPAAAARGCFEGRES